MAKYDKDEGEKYGAINKPPMVKETLEKEIRFLRQKLRGKFPLEIPRDYSEASLWWMTNQKPANDRYERPHKAAVTGRDGVRWVNPYADRLVASLRRYVRLGRQERQFIMAALEDGVWYNGDSFPFFKRVYEETDRMERVGVEAYRREAVEKYGRLVGRIK